MSGVTGDNPYRASGVIAAAAAGGGVSWQDVITASTFTAVAGNGYPVNTTSNACTVTLPASASVGDEIIFTDYVRNWGTNALTINQYCLRVMVSNTIQNSRVNAYSLNQIFTKSKINGFCIKQLFLALRSVSEREIEYEASSEHFLTTSKILNFIFIF